MKKTILSKELKILNRKYQKLELKIKDLENRLDELEDDYLLLGMEIYKHTNHSQRVTPPEGVPNHFCYSQTVSRASCSNPFTQDQVQKMYIEFALLEGDMLYMPCGWFHEVKSFSGRKGYHLAFNYWYYPPYVELDNNNNIVNRFDKPYIDDYILQLNKKLYERYGIIETKKKISQDSTYEEKSKKKSKEKKTEKEKSKKKKVKRKKKI